MLIFVKPLEGDNSVVSTKNISLNPHFNPEISTVINTNLIIIICCHCCSCYFINEEIKVLVGLRSLG